MGFYIILIYILSRVFASPIRMSFPWEKAHILSSVGSWLCRSIRRLPALSPDGSPTSCILVATSSERRSFPLAGDRTKPSTLS